MTMPKMKQADSGIWYAHWTENRRSKRTSLGARCKREARTRFAQWLLSDGKAGRSPADCTISDLWREYEKSKVHTLASPATAMCAWKALAPHFGSLRPADVPGAVEGYIATRSRKVRQSTIRRELVQLRAVLSWAADARRGRPLIDPVPAFSMPRNSPPRDRWLTDDEIERLYAASNDPRVSLFMRLALETAGRKSAILELTWGRVDFDTKVIHLHNPDREETKKRRASVPISPALLPYLREAHKTRTDGLVLGRGGDVYRQIAQVAKAAGVPGATPNVFRHTAATKMARRGVPLWIVAKVLGNSLAVVEKTYAKHAPDDLRAAVALISSEEGADPGQ